MDDVALGTKVFMRDEKLRNLLESIERTDIPKVYVADDGKETKEKAEIYAGSYDFDLEVLQLEYDAGLGYGRKQIVDRLEAKYFLLVDSDHEIPPNVDVLRTMLEADPDIGGIAGNIAEPEYCRLFQNAKNIRVEDNDLVREIDRDAKSMDTVAGYPFVTFDFIPNAALFRRECVEDYCWDPEYVIGHEHVDFYIGHWKQTDWNFGICPSVTFPHYPGGSPSYESNRHDDEKIRADREYFLEKWGFDDLRMETMYWFDTHEEQPLISDRARNVYEQYGAMELLKRGLYRGKEAVAQNLSSLRSS